MINLVKSQPAPPSLAVEKAKASGTYRTEEVLIRLHADFHNKCYICEDCGITSINVEHFLPHEGDRDKMFDWNNLFFACGHCNNTKLAKAEYDNILNCTNAAHQVANWIRYSTVDDGGFSKIKVVIEEVVAQNGVAPTIALLNDVYNRQKPITKRFESDNLRNRLQKELAIFMALLEKFYFAPSLSEIEKTATRADISGHLQKPSAFSAFKIWIIRSKQTYMADFAPNIP
jgi:hypothetical protein